MNTGTPFEGLRPGNSQSNNPYNQLYEEKLEPENAVFMGLLQVEQKKETAEIKSILKNRGDDFEYRDYMIPPDLVTAE